MVGLDKIRDERGQASVEAALVVPALVLIVFGLLQACWIIFCSTSLSAAVEHAQYSITAEQAASQDPDELMRDKVLDAAPGLAGGTLTVTGTQIKALPSEAKSEELPDEDFERYRLATKNELTQRVEVTSEVVYQPASFAPGLIPTPKFVREVKASRIVSERFELG